jgi:hypothetical protein
MSNKQSSIEWLCERLALKLGVPMAISFYIDHAEEIEQAKAMHKEEIKNAVGVGSQLDRDYLYGYHDKAEQYYNETFEGGNK